MASRPLRIVLCALTALLVPVTASVAFAAPDTMPATVAAALDRAELPRDSLVALVQEVGSDRPRFAWHADRPVNPASVTKLLTTFASLELRSGMVAKLA